MSDLILTQYILGALFVIFGIFVLILGTQTIKSGSTQKRLDEFVINQDKGRQQTSKNIRFMPREFSGSLFSRTIRPAVRKVIAFFGRFTPENSMLQLDHQLTVANNPYNLTASSFYGIRIFILLIGLLLAFLINIQNITLEPKLLLSGLLVITLFILFPILWLRTRMKTAQEKIRRGLPDVLDMLSVCTSAGLGFDQSMQKVSDYWETSLGQEFKRVLQEIEMGVSRADALRNMANRTEVPELSSFVAIIIQAEMLGMAIANVLHDQSDQMRDQRQLRARQIANKLPVKMLPPLAFMILPALMAVILGPSLITIFKLFMAF